MFSVSVSSGFEHPPIKDNQGCVAIYLMGVLDDWFWAASLHSISLKMCTVE